MNGVVFHIVSGHSFFTGIFLLVAAAFASTASRPIFKRMTTLSFLIGAIAVLVSSTAISYWWYSVAVMASLVWTLSWLKTTWRPRAAYLMAVAWLVAGAIELPYHITPSLASSGDRSITIIGDSVTAGVGGDEKSETWPSIIGREHDLLVQDISHVGETAASALKRARSQEISGQVVIVEVGGNDVLGSTSSKKFGSDLNELLSHLVSPGRQVVMFELPLPPMRHEYGRLQRKVAAKHGVILVPKRIFLSVLAGGNSTLDSIHLSQAGHQGMADCVWQLTKDAFVTREAGSP